MFKMVWFCCRAEEHVSLLSTLSGFKVKSVVDRHQVIIELIDPVKEAVDSVDTQTVDEEFLTSKRPTTSLELTITYTQQAVPRLADVKV